MVSRRELLHGFDWHDLPVNEIAVGFAGAGVVYPTANFWRVAEGVG